MDARRVRRLLPLRRHGPGPDAGLAYDGRRWFATGRRGCVDATSWTDVLDESVRQHVFGDIIRRRVGGESRWQHSGAAGAQ